MLGQPNTTKENPQRRKKLDQSTPIAMGQSTMLRSLQNFELRYFGNGVQEQEKEWKWKELKPDHGIASNLFLWKFPEFTSVRVLEKFKNGFQSLLFQLKKKDDYSLPPKLRHETVYCLQVFTSICTLCGFCQYSNNCKTPQQSIKDIQSIQFNMQSSLQHMRSKDGQKGSDPEQVSSQNDLPLILQRPTHFSHWTHKRPIPRLVAWSM